MNYSVLNARKHVKLQKEAEKELHELHKAYENTLFEQSNLKWKLKLKIWSNPEFKNNDIREINFKCLLNSDPEYREASENVKTAHYNYEMCKSKVNFHLGMRITFVAEVYSNLSPEFLKAADTDMNWETSQGPLP